MTMVAVGFRTALTRADSPDGRAFVRVYVPSNARLRLSLWFQHFSAGHQLALGGKHCEPTLSLCPIGVSCLRVCALSLLFVGSAAAQETEDDDAKLRPAEPDYTVVNLPTTLPLPLHRGNFHLTHRFSENLRNDGFGTQASNLWGLDQGATIQFEYRFGLFKHVEAIAARTNFNRTIQLGGKFDLVHQDGSRWLGFSGLV